MNILGMGPMELLLIVVLALIVFGPAKLPEIMGQVGRAIGDFRRATSDLSDEFNRTIQAELQEGRSVLTETRAAVGDVQTTMNSAVLGASAPTRVVTPDEAAAATNGTIVDSHADSVASADRVTETKPVVADTSTWNWETAVSNDAAADSKPAVVETNEWSWETAPSSETAAESKPAVVETTEWSWETAAPAAPPVSPEGSASGADKPSGERPRDEPAPPR